MRSYDSTRLFCRGRGRERVGRRSNRGRAGFLGFTWRFVPGTRHKDVRYLRNKVTGEEWLARWYVLDRPVGMPKKAFEALKSVRYPQEEFDAASEWEFVYHVEHDLGEWVEQRKSCGRDSKYRPGEADRNMARAAKKRARRDGRYEIQEALADVREVQAFYKLWLTERKLRASLDLMSKNFWRWERARTELRRLQNKMGARYKAWRDAEIVELETRYVEELDLYESYSNFYDRDDYDWQDDYDPDYDPEAAYHYASVNDVGHEDLYAADDPAEARWVDLYVAGAVDPPYDWHDDYDPCSYSYEDEDEMDELMDRRWSLSDYLNGKLLPQDPRIHADEDHRNDKLKAGERYFKQHKRTVLKPILPPRGGSPYSAHRPILTIR